MKAVSGRAFAKILERNDWSLLRIHGSHHIYGRKGSEVRLSARYTAISRSKSACNGTS